MPDPWLTESDISGDWSGHYVHRVGPGAGRPYRIVAQIHCRSGRILGSMTDEITTIRRGYKALVHAQSERLGDVALARAFDFIDRHPHAVVESVLPAESTLEGTWDGETVRFVKTYLGVSTATLDLGGRRIPTDRREGPRVDYRGVHDPASRAIRGEWTIRPEGLFGRFRRPREIGDFVLEKRR